MIRHLTRADYKVMPWANGHGTTTELMRADHPQGGLLWRISVATVAEDGPFSLFTGTDRNLTVISGPGFDLVGDATLRCDPLRPVAFPGDVVVSAAGIKELCEDFNVMTARDQMRASVRLVEMGTTPVGGECAVFALGPAVWNGVQMSRRDLIVTDQPGQITRGPVLVVQFLR